MSARASFYRKRPVLTLPRLQNYLQRQAPQRISAKQLSVVMECTPHHVRKVLREHPDRFEAAPSFGGISVWTVRPGESSSKIAAVTPACRTAVHPMGNGLGFTQVSPPDVPVMALECAGRETSEMEKRSFRVVPKNDKIPAFTVEAQRLEVQEGVVRFLNGEGTVVAIAAISELAAACESVLFHSA